MSESAQTVNHFTQADRETIIRLTVNQERMIADIKALTETIDGRIGDHEGRIRSIERVIDDLILVRKLVYGMVGLILISVIGSIITLTIK